MHQVGISLSSLPKSGSRLYMASVYKVLHKGALAMLYGRMLSHSGMSVKGVKATGKMK